MKTEKELNGEILRVSTIIAEKFPELSKYIAEMPVKIKGAEGYILDINDLKDYGDSLNTLLNNYSDCYNSKQSKNHFYISNSDIFNITI